MADRENKTKRNENITTTTAAKNNSKPNARPTFILAKWTQPNWKLSKLILKRHYVIGVINLANGEYKNAVCSTSIIHLVNGKNHSAIVATIAAVTVAAAAIYRHHRRNQFNLCPVLCAVFQIYQQLQLVSFHNLRFINVIFYTIMLWYN